MDRRGGPRREERPGLRVVLVLRVALDSAVERNRFLWHGMIMPREDAQVAAWFDRYREFVSAWAAVAAAAGIDVLGIGSELNAIASTRPVDAVPELEAYYLDPAKQSELRQRVTRFEASIDPKHLHGAWRETYSSVPRYIDDQIEAHRRWAEQVTGSVAGAAPRAGDRDHQPAARSAGARVGRADRRGARGLLR